MFKRRTNLYLAIVTSRLVASLVVRGLQSFGVQLIQADLFHLRAGNWLGNRPIIAINSSPEFGIMRPQDF